MLSETPVVSGHIYRKESGKRIPSQHVYEILNAAVKSKCALKCFDDEKCAGFNHNGAICELFEKDIDAQDSIGFNKYV